MEKPRCEARPSPGGDASVREGECVSLFLCESSKQ